MTLFPADSSENLLPYDGELIDFGYIYDAQTANIIFDYLKAHTPWRQDEYLKTFGQGASQINKHILTNRQVAWYAEQERTYTYAGSTKKAYAFSPAINKIKARVEAITQTKFNACLLNLYHSGADGMSWHSDSEDELQKGSAIASLSFGAKRKFMVKHKRDKKRLDLWLSSGQLIVMQGAMQTHWLHAVPKTSNLTEARINLTFRKM